MEKFEKTRKLILSLVFVHWLVVPFKYFMIIIMTVSPEDFLLAPMTYISALTTPLVIKPLLFLFPFLNIGFFRGFGPIISVMLIIIPLLWIFPFSGVKKREKWGAFLIILFCVALLVKVIFVYDLFFGISIYFGIVLFFDITIALLLLIYSLIYLNNFPDYDN